MLESRSGVDSRECERVSEEEMMVDDFYSQKR